MELLIPEQNRFTFNSTFCKIWITFTTRVDDNSIAMKNKTSAFVKSTNYSLTSDLSQN